MHRRLPGTPLLCGATIALLTSGCDIVQGFRNAGDALFPVEQAYLDAPGYRLVQGGYRWLQFTAGSDLYLLARSADPNDSSVYSMRYADPKPCAIPNVSDYRPGQGIYAGPAIIAYHERRTDGQFLRFADANCRVYGLSIENAGLDFIELAQGFVVLADGELSLADPEHETLQPIIQSVQAVVPNAFGSFGVIESAQQLYVFNSQWQSVQKFGSGVVGGAGAGKSFYFEDTAGIHRLSASDSGAIDTLVAPGACGLDFPPAIGSSGWITYHSPCQDGSFYAYADGTQHASKLDVPSNAKRVSPVAAWPKTDGDPEKDPFYLFYLTDTNALFVRTPTKDDHKIGDNSVLERVVVVASDEGTHGYALVDVDSNTGTGRYVEWQEPSGAVQTLGEGEPRYSTDLVLNYDSQSNTGDFALPEPSGLVVVANRVPSYFRFTDPKGRWTGLLHDYDGKVAELSFAAGGLDFSDYAQATAHAASPKPIPDLTPVASGVRPDWRARFLWSLPGLAYLTSWDADNDIGRFEYRNLELGFTAVVSEGVSDYISTGDSVIYSVPFGDAAGIWVARAR